MNSIIKYGDVLPYVSEAEFKRAQAKLNSHMSHKSFFREKQFFIYNGMDISDDFTGENIRRCHYVNCRFKGAKLINTGMSGSIIKSSEFTNEFYKNVLQNTKLDSCQIDGCKFSHFDLDTLKNVNFSKSIISNTEFVNCKIISANFTDAILINVVFRDCIWESVSLENTVFVDTKLIAVDLIKLNFEFSQFHNVTLYDVRLPFPTIPYIINGLSYLRDKTTGIDKIWVSSAKSETKKMSLEEYFDCLDDLEIFYSKIQDDSTLNYFPLANIYIAKRHYDKAFAAIVLGIEFAIKIHDFRSIYYYCKLLQITKEFDGHQLAEVNRLISNKTNTSHWNFQERINYSHYIDLIRNTLMNERISCSSLRFNIITNISHNDHDKLSVIIKCIDKIADTVGEISDSSVKHYVEIRRGSYEVFVNFFGDSTDLLSVLCLTQIAMFGCTKFINNILDIIERLIQVQRGLLENEHIALENDMLRLNIKKLNDETYKDEKTKIEIERGRLENEKISLENKKIRLENEKLKLDIEKQGNEMYKEIRTHGVKIHGNHTLLDKMGDIDDYNLLYYLYK